MSPASTAQQLPRDASGQGETGLAACFTGVGRPFELRSYPLPDVEHGALLLRTTMASVCGSDLHQWRGTVDLVAYGRPMPQILGHELTGVIHRLGSGLTQDSAGVPIAIGDRLAVRYFHPCGRCRGCLTGATRTCAHARRHVAVSCDEPPHFTGGFAQYHYTPPGAAFFRIPDEVGDTAIASANCALAQVICAFDMAHLRLGERVVIQGGGALGICAVAVARELGAGSITLIDGIDARLELADRFGADSLIDYREAATADERVAAVRDLTDGGADIVGEFAGTPSACPEGLQMLAPAGRYLAVGNVAAGRTFAMDPSWLAIGNRSMLGVGYYEARHLKAALDLVTRTLDRYPWEAMVSHQIELSRLDYAFELAAAGAAGRVVVVSEGCDLRSPPYHPVT